MVKLPKNHFKRVISSVLACAMSATILPYFPVNAEETVEKYPYTMFAASDAEGAITVNTGNFCVNGSIATNGTIVSSGNMNINGTGTEFAGEEMLYIFKKLNYMYFSGTDVEIYTSDYSYEDININIDDPMNVQGDLELTGNINLTTAIKALDDVVLSGEVKNTNESVICSENGDIVIDSANVNLNGLVYAPNGDVQITAQNLNMNSVVIMAQTITINAPNVNANYSSSIAEFIGTESEVELELSAFGEYSSESNSINIFWTSTIPRGSYEIQISDDNTTYTTIGVAVDVESYEYPIAEEFEKRYFKVTETTYYGEVLSTLPFVAEKEDNGYVIQFLDTDEDGLPDVFEGNYGTDPVIPDTDSDRLSDFEEIYLTQTDPNVWSSVNESVSDAEIDCDGDGISNINEIAGGTNPLVSDTDEDGLSDSDEIALYGTNPLLYDTDGDGISDGSEVKMGLSPTNSATYGTSDSEYRVEQSILADSEVFTEINTPDSPYKLSLDLKTNKFAEDEVYVYQSGYSSSIENDALLGKSVEIAIDDSCDFSDIVLKYEIEEVYIENAVGTYAEYEEFQGIKRFNVFKFFDEINMLLPIETQYDTENNTVYAEIDGCGTYCVMDMEIWIDSLGLEENTEEIEPMFFSATTESVSDDTESKDMSFSEDYTEETMDLSLEQVPMLMSFTWEPVYTDVPLDLVFVLQTAGTSSSAFNREVNIINDVAESVFASYDDVRIYIVEYDKTTGSILTANNNRLYLNNSTEVADVLETITYKSETDYCDRGAAFTLVLNDIELRNNADIFIYHLVNGANTDNTGVDQLDICDKIKAKYSEIHPSGWRYDSSSYGETVADAIDKSQGINLTLDSSTANDIITHIAERISPPQVVYQCLIGTNWKKIALNGEISASSVVNSDTDYLIDWLEIDSDHLIRTEDGSFELPSFQEYLTILDDETESSINSVFTQKFGDSLLAKWNFYDSVKILPLLSNPTMEDTDGDGLKDHEDPNKLKIDLNRNLDFSKALFESFDEYLNLIMPPIYNDEGDLINYQNCYCSETKLYFDVIMWPYLRQEYLKNDPMSLAHDSSRIMSWEYRKFLNENYCSIYDSPLLPIVNNIKDKASTFYQALCYELKNPRETHEKAMKQLFLGNFSEDVTIMGTVFQLGLGLTGLDVAADIRDASYDGINWCLGWELRVDNVFQTTVDAVAFLPLIGALKYCDEVKLLLKHNPDAAADLLKNTSLKLVDETGNIVGNSDEVVKMARAAALENLTSNSENAARLSKFIQKYGIESFEQSEEILQSVLKLSDESADAFLKVASKQGDEFFDVLKNCDGYLDDVVNYVARDGQGAVDIVIKFGTDGIDYADIPSSTLYDILSNAKGSRPDPLMYLSPKYIKNHLQQFDDGISVIQTDYAYNRYSVTNGFVGVPDDNTLFVLPQTYCDDIIKKANGNMAIIEEELGFPSGYFKDGGGLVRIDVDDVADLNLRIPNGNETGANTLWVPGGYTYGGIPEAVSDTIPLSEARITTLDVE